MIDDLRLLRGFATAREHAEMLQVNATALGLQAAYDEDEELAILTEASDESAAGYLTPAAFARVPRYLAARGRQAAGTYVSGGLGLLPNKLADQCFALQDAQEKIAVLELKQRAVVLVVEWVETKRGRVDEYTAFRKQLEAQMASYHTQQALTEWLNPQNIRIRNGFERVGLGSSQQ